MFCVVGHDAPRTPATAYSQTLAVIFKMKERINLGLTILAIGTILFSCDSGFQRGSEISKDDIEFIKGLGILDDNEKLILFDKQSDIRTSGNFFSDKRIASYWIDKRDQTKTSIDFGLYPEIDTILTKDLSKALTYASYLEVVLNVTDKDLRYIVDRLLYIAVEHGCRSVAQRVKPCLFFGYRLDRSFPKSLYWTLECQLH